MRAKTKYREIKRFDLHPLTNGHTTLNPSCMYDFPKFNYIFLYFPNLVLFPRNTAHRKRAWKRSKVKVINYSYRRHETCGIERRWLWDIYRDVTFTRWQHPAVRHGRASLCLAASLVSLLLRLRFVEPEERCAV